MAVYIQIGANVGSDYFQRLIQALPSKNNEIHLIEVNSDLIPQLQENYQKTESQRINVHNIAITPQPQEYVELHMFGNHTEYSSLINRLSLGGSNAIRRCECTTLNNFFKDQKIVEVELLFLDCEGLDVEILYWLDLTNVNIKNIIFEVWPYENDDLSGVYKTGPNTLQQFLEKIKHRFFVESVLIDDQPSMLLRSK